MSASNRNLSPPTPTLLLLLLPHGPFQQLRKLLQRPSLEQFSALSSCTRREGPAPMAPPWTIVVQRRTRTRTLSVSGSLEDAAGHNERCQQGLVVWVAYGMPVKRDLFCLTCPGICRTPATESADEEEANKNVRGLALKTYRVFARKRKHSLVMLFVSLRFAHGLQGL